MSSHAIAAYQRSDRAHAVNRSAAQNATSNGAGTPTTLGTSRTPNSTMNWMALPVVSHTREVTTPTSSEARNTSTTAASPSSRDVT